MPLYFSFYVTTVTSKNKDSNRVKTHNIRNKIYKGQLEFWPCLLGHLVLEVKTMTYAILKQQLSDAMHACNILSRCYPNSGVRSKCKALSKKLSSLIEDVEIVILKEELNHERNS